MVLPPIEPGESLLEYLRRTMRPERYPPIGTAGSFDKDGGPLPMTGGARQARQDAGEAKRRMERARQDAALGRALQWTGCWGG